MFEERSPEEQMFQQAIEALRRGERSRAKDLLTRLLKTDQNNATYWVWMSAAMDTQKERIARFCRTFGPAFGWPTARRSVISAFFKSFVSRYESPRLDNTDGSSGTILSAEA